MAQIRQDQNQFSGTPLLAPLRDDFLSGHARFAPTNETMLFFGLPSGMSGLRKVVGVQELGIGGYCFRLFVLGVGSLDC